MTPADRLEHFRERAEAHAGTNAGAKARLRARAVCEAHGLPVPDWAQPVSPTEAGQRARQVSARKRSRERPLVSDKPRTAAALEHPPAVAVELPEALREWRRQHPGSIVSVGAAGVTLYPFSGEPRRYGSAAEAIAAVVDS